MTIILFFDFEVFKHDWLVVIKDVTSHREHVIVNNVSELLKIYDAHKNDIWIGYNSRQYDQYILKAILCGFNPKEINDYMIAKGRPGWQFSSLLREIPLNNYDVMTSFHSLKQLEGFLGNDIRESSVPFDIDRKLTPEELAETIKYCRHDVEQTMAVFAERKEEFESHLSLIQTFKLPLSHISKTKVQLASIILDAHKRDHDDEFDITFPNTLKITKYTQVPEWYENNRDYTKSLELTVAGVPHVFGWGGLHGGLEKYSTSGVLLNVDVASYYPALIIEYGYGSRNMADPEKYRQIRDMRLKYKAEKNKLHKPLKIVLNSCYGATKDKNNNLYDPRQGNNICVGGQLLLLDLIERLEGYCELVQSNTDGLILKLESEDDIDKIKSICREWETRTRMVLEFEQFEKIYQKDVNNYLIVRSNGTYKSKGAYVKELEPLDYDLPIINTAIKDYMTKNIPVEQTILRCNRLKEFQKICKVSAKYMYALHGTQRLTERCLRVFASKEDDPGVFKLKNHDRNPEKIALTPEHCFIVNDNVNNRRVPRELDKQWYVNLAQKRLRDFGVVVN